MKLAMIMAAGGSALVLGACATTQATPEEYAACREMQERMGVGDRHDHAEQRGQGRSAMNISHSRCRQILSQPEPTN